MPSSLSAPTGRPGTRAAGRSAGSLFFSVFGTAWLTLALFAFGRLHWASFAPLLLLLCLQVFLALRSLAAARPIAAGEPVDPRRQRDDRLFGWINAGQGLAIFLLFFTLPRFGRQEFAVAGAVIVVGLHFLVMPPTYRYRSNFVLGVTMTVWGAVCMAAFHGDRMIAFSALGAGLMLWSLAAWALQTASTLLRSVPRGSR